MKKKLIALLLAAVICAGCFSGCNNSADGGAGTGSEAASSATTTGSSETAPETQIKVEYSKGFKIEQLADGIKRVTDGENRELVLIPRDLGEIPAEYADSTVIRTPVRNAVYLSSTQVSMLTVSDDKEIWDNVGGVVVNTDWSAVEKVQSGLDGGTITNVGSDANAPDYEIIAALSPDVVFVSTGSFPQTDVIAKLDELGINYAVDNEYMETDYLARMEWMKFILTFYNADETAFSAFTEAKAEIEAVKTAINGAESPKIASFCVFGGEAYVTSDSTWVGSMFADLGITNLFGTVTAYSLSLEQLYEVALEADVIIYTDTPTYTPDLAAVEAAFPQITECRAYKNGCVYQYLDAYWFGIADGETVAADLAAVAYPEVFAGRELTYYKKLSA